MLDITRSKQPVGVRFLHEHTFLSKDFSPTPVKLWEIFFFSFSGIWSKIKSSWFLSSTLPLPLQMLNNHNPKIYGEWKRKISKLSDWGAILPLSLAIQTILNAAGSSLIKIISVRSQWNMWPQPSSMFLGRNDKSLLNWYLIWWCRVSSSPG